MRSYRTLAVLGLAATALVLAGCSLRVYTRGVDGSGPHEDIVVGATVAVLPDDDAAGSEDTTRKLERLLHAQGYPIVPACEADFLVLYHYEIRTYTKNRRLEPLSGPASGMRICERDGPFDHTVHLRVIEARPWLQSGETRLAWAGAAQISEAPTQGARFLDLALVCAMDEFGVADGDIVADRIRLYDRRVRDLD